MKNLVLAGRLVFGAWMLVSGLNHFLSFLPQPVAHEPLAMQLLAAVNHSRLMDVVMTIQVLTGVALLSGFFVPTMLCICMPVSTCILYWSAILEHSPVQTVLGLAVFALNGLLMLAYLDYYRLILDRYAPALGEA